MRTSPAACTGTALPRIVDAWLERPGRLKVVDQRGERTWVDGNEFVSEPSSAIRWAHHVTPRLREDGLLIERPEGTYPWSEFEVDDPMYDNYLWVAMLDPLELSAGVDLTDVLETTHHGRPVWSARAVPAQGYEPRCGCCPLLSNLRTDQDEYGDEFDSSDATYPEAYQVLLDRATGFVVSVVPLWAAGERGRRDLGFDVEIHASN